MTSKAAYPPPELMKAKPREQAYEPVGDGQTCDRCTAYAPFSIADYNDDLQPITTWFACGRHLSRVLREGDWNLDAVEVRYLTAEQAREAM